MTNELQEVLSIQQRRARKMQLRRLKGKIQRGRRLAQKRMANPEKLKKRAAKKAKEMIRKRVAGKRGEKYKQLPLSARIQIDKQVAKRKSMIQKLAKRMLPKVRKAERERLKKVRQKVQESFEYQTIHEAVQLVERDLISEKIKKNLKKKAKDHGIPYESVREAYFFFLRSCDKQKPEIDEQAHAFQSLNSYLANRANEEIANALQYHRDASIPLHENVFRMYSTNYFKLYREARRLYQEGTYQPVDHAEQEILETDIGDFATLTEGSRSERVPLDCPMVEEDDKDVELNKPKRGGPKKFYVHVRDPSTGNIKKVTFGDTTGLKVKLDDKEAARSFAARHKCSEKKDKTQPGYWACRLPRYAKQLGLSGGGSHFW